MIEPGTLLQNRYRVTRQIGHGGMGAVFVATDERFRSTVAIKQTFFDDPSLRKAFEREAHLLNHLRHAALPKVSDHFVEDSGQFLVMEFIEGSDLSELIQERGGGAFPASDVLRWADELLDALDYLHTHEPPVVHRDIKPQNLKLTTRGQIVLLDFGLAKGSPTQAHTAAHTSASVFGYSRNYAPLEQMQGTGTDPRSDLYSLGATVYHMLTGAAPVDALTRAGALVNNQPDPLRAAHLAHPQVPKSVSDLLQRAMAQNAAHRFSTAAEMRAALRLVAGNVQQPAAAHEQASLLDATVVGTTLGAHEGRARPSNSAVQGGRVTSAQPAQSATVMRETTVVDGVRRAPQSPKAAAASYSATGLYQPPPPPARKSHKLVIIAVVALVAACASVPVLLSRRSADDNRPAAEAQPSPLAPAEFRTDPAQPAGGGVTQGLSSPSSATNPADTQTTSARPSGDSSATNAQPAQTGSAPNAAGNAPNTAGDGALNASPTDSGRSGLVINAPAPASYPTANDAARAAAAEEEARRTEEARRAQERPAYPEGDRRPPPHDGFRPPPDGRRPPPPPHHRP